VTAIESDVTRPAPIRTEDNDGYWTAAMEGRLGVQRCAQCGRLQHPPRPMCPACHSLDQRIVDLAGTGVIYSFSLLHHPQHPAFTYPVVAVLVDLDEGVRVASNLVGVDPSDVRIGLPVQVSFAPAKDGTAVPVFEPRTPA
jgi:uncharacterized OB-fold protein